MTDVLDPASMIEAAQEAVITGDYVAAERHLRDAASFQEAHLGPLHPDLARTLSDLAIICERTDKIAEAERSYRRAHAIAVASLSPRDPFVAASVRNLVEFCAAHGIPIWRPRAARSDDENSFAPETNELELYASELSAAEGSTLPVPMRRARTTRAIALLGSAAVVILFVVFAVRWSRTISVSGAPERVLTEQRETIAPPAEASTPPATSAEVPSPPGDVTVPTVDVAAPHVDVTTPPAERPEPGVATIVPTQVSVLRAQICSAIAKVGSPDWQCASANGVLQPGTYLFYTRVLTNASTTIEHRWYRDDRLHQTIKLRIAASPIVGYRTFSSTTISPERSGNWRVELRAADGTLLQDERFEVRR